MHDALRNKKMTDSKYFFNWQTTYDCEECGKQFQTYSPKRRGEVPKYCCNAHKQKAYRKRQGPGAKP